MFVIVVWHNDNELRFIIMFIITESFPSSPKISFPLWGYMPIDRSKLIKDIHENHHIGCLVLVLWAQCLNNRPCHKFGTLCGTHSKKIPHHFISIFNAASTGQPYDWEVASKHCYLLAEQWVASQFQVNHMTKPCVSLIIIGVTSEEDSAQKGHCKSVGTRILQTLEVEVFPMEWYVNERNTHPWRTDWA